MQGLSRSTAEITELLKHYGTQGLELDAHSRGSMTVGNALEVLKNNNTAPGTLSETYLKFFGPAYTPKKPQACFTSSVAAPRTA